MSNPAFIAMEENNLKNVNNGTAHYEKCKKLFENQHLLLLRDIWWSKF
jgi:hypothetical protein